MNSPAKIAVLGSVNLDFVVRTQRLPTAGETVSGGSFFTTPGGKGGNQALAARLLGADVALHACVGQDDFAKSALENLEKAGVDLSQLLRTDAAKTGAAFINVDAAAENQIAVASGANAQFSADKAPTIAADWIITQLEVDPNTILAAAQKSQAKLCINAAPVKALPQELLERADLIIVNEVEYDSYAAQLADLDTLVALTLGAQGARLMRANTQVAASLAPKVDAIDTTGAGDCFVAALTVFLAEGMAHDAALRAACHCGALAATQLGAQAATPTRTALQAAFPALKI